MDSTIENEPQAYQQANSEERRTWRRKSKINHFWPWFTNVGFKKFLHVYGRKYDENCEADRKLVTELWNLDKESWSMVERHGGRSALPHKGGRRQISPDYEFECLEQQNRATNFRTNDLSPPRRACTTYYLVDENANDIEGKRLKPRIRATNAASRILPSSSQPCAACKQQQGSRSSKRILSKRNFLDRLRFQYIALGHFPCFELQFVLVNPFIVAPSVNDVVVVYPAEISITRFTLERGPISCWSSLINFDPNLVDATRHCFHQSIVEVNALRFGVPLKSAQGRCPCEVWRTFLTKYNNEGVVICDAGQIEILDRALHFLASTVGPDQLQIHAEIMDKMVAAQDFISALGWMYYRVIKKPLPNYLTDESIDRQFTNTRRTLLSFPKCCNYHERKSPNRESRRHCTVARTAALIEAVCNLCYVGDLVKFRDHYNDSTHSMRHIFVDSATLQFSRTTPRFTEDCPHDGGPYARHGAIVKVNLSDAMSRLMKIGSFCCPT